MKDLRQIGHQIADLSNQSNAVDSSAEDSRPHSIETAVNLTVTFTNTFHEVAAFTADNIRGNRVYKTQSRTLRMTDPEGNVDFIFLASFMK